MSQCWPCVWSMISSSFIRWVASNVLYLVVGILVGVALVGIDSYYGNRRFE